MFERSPIVSPTLVSTRMALALDKSISRAQDLLKLLSEEDRTRQEIFDFVNEDHSVPLWVQESDSGWTVLHFAAKREDDLMVARFLELGANWNLCKLPLNAW